jgi:sugar phosphate permease
VLFVRLYETPKYLIHGRRHEEALLVLQLMANENRAHVLLRMEDLPVQSAQENVRDATKKKGAISQIKMLFIPYYRMTTILLWIIWFTVTLGYTIFNVFLPKLMEERHRGSSSNLAESLSSFALYSSAGIPGSVLCTWLVDTKLGRKGAMWLSTVATLLGLISFALVRGFLLETISSAWMNFSASIMYAAVYTYTPG